MQSAPITFQQHKNVKRMNMKLNNWIENRVIKRKKRKMKTTIRIETPQISNVVKLIKNSIK